jgi:hypothetical protein
MDIYGFIVAAHIIGTILGAGGATVAEVQINLALKDKSVSPDERALMHGNYILIRVGMALILASVLGMIWYQLGQGNEWILTSEKLHAKYILFAAIVINAVLLTKRMMPLWLGASISFTSWWGATILGLMGKLPYTLPVYLGVYVVAVILVAGVLHLVRTRATAGGMVRAAQVPKIIRTR